MVLKTTICRFSGLRIYPGKGILFIRVDSQQYLFLNKKCKSLFNNRLRPAKLAWTAAYRKQHKKDQARFIQTFSSKQMLSEITHAWAMGGQSCETKP